MAKQTEQIELDESRSLELKVALGMAPEDVRGELMTRPSSRVVVPGLNDIQLASVTRVGQRGEFIQPHDWENLLPTLAPGRELLWIVRKERDQFRFYLGLKENSDVLFSPETARQRRQDFRAIANHFGRRAFPESRLTQIDNQVAANVLDEFEQSGSGHLTVVTGVPSPKLIDEGSTFGSRDEERRPYASLNDALEPFIDEDSFTLVFSVSRASRDELEAELRRATAIRSELRPYIEGEDTKTVGGQKTRTKTKGKATNEGQSASEGRWLLPKLIQLVVGSEKQKEGFQWGRGASVNYQRGSSKNWGTSVAHGSQRSESKTSHWFNAHIQLIDELTELRIKHLTQAMGTGAYRSYVAVYSGSEHLGRRIGKTLSAALGGAHSHLQPFQSISYSGPYADFPLRYCAPGYTFLPDVPLLDTDQACQLMLMPDAELPGLRLKKAVFYGRSPGTRAEQARAGETIKLGNSAFHEPIMSGQAFQESVPVKISRDDMLSHVLIAGTTGSGKTMRTIDILNRLSIDDFRIIVLETAKKTYRRYLDRGKKPMVYSLGGSSGTRFRINPFYFDPGTNLKKHISVLADALNDLLPMEALIGPKLREAVLRCYINTGWDIETGNFAGEGEPFYPTMIEFNHEVESLCDQLGYSGELNQNYRGALQGRARLFIDDLYQDLFVFDGEEDFGEMFGQDTILELDDLPPSEINMPAFVTSMVLQRLRAHCETRRKGAGRKAKPPYYLVVVEEAHNILHRKLEENQDPRQTGGSRHLLTQVVRLLQEGRDLGIGVMVLDQSPESLADAVRKNTNTKIVHRIIDGGETETIGKSLGLSEDDWPDLTHLDTGECIVGLKGGGRPIKLAPIEREQLPAERVDDWAESPGESYGAADRLLSRFKRKVMSCHVIGSVAEELVNSCNDDVVKAGRILGRWQAWNGKWDDTSDTYRCPTTREKIWCKLGAIAFADVDMADVCQRELAALMLNSLHGAGNFASTPAQREVLGEDWMQQAWPYFNTTFTKVVPQQGYEPDLAGEVHEALADWFASSSDERETDQVIRWICSDPEAQELVFRVSMMVFLGAWQNSPHEPEDHLDLYFAPSIAEVIAPHVSPVSRDMRPKVDLVATTPAE